VFGAFNRLSPVVNSQQLQLSKQFIDSNVEEISIELIRLRKQIDEIWFKGKSTSLSEESNLFLQSKINRIKKKYSNELLSQYPIGHCFHISSTAIEYIEKFELQNAHSVFYNIGLFIKEGGTFKKIWGVYNKEHFQTAIQIGNWYFDIAADTFEWQKKQVEFTTLQNCEFSEISSIEQYASILKKTENKELLLNTIFPNLWPYFPFFIKNEKKNSYSIPDSKYLSGLCTKNDFELLKKYLENPISKGISKEVKDAIINQFSTLKEKYIQKEFIETQCLSKEDLNAYLVEFARNKADTLKAVNYINFMLKSKSI
jgi:hypothetical protein